MPKSIPIDPIEVRRRATLASPVIPLNAYQTDPAAETVKYGREALVRILDTTVGNLGAYRAGKLLNRVV